MLTVTFPSTAPGQLLHTCTMHARQHLHVCVHLSHARFNHCVRIAGTGFPALTTAGTCTNAL